MPNSLRSKIKHLAYKGEFNEREKDRLLSALDHEIDVTYICDGKKCPECSKLCNHTTDISHAINFEPVTFTDEKTILNYEEKMPRYKPIILQEHDAEPRTLRAILDTATEEIYLCKLTWRDAMLLGMTIEEVQNECETEGEETEKGNKHS